MLPEADGGFVILSIDQPAGIIDRSRPAGDSGQEVDVVLQDHLVILVSLLVHLKLSLQHLVGGHGIGLRGVGVLEVIATAVEPVSGPEIPGLHIVVDCLDIDHQLGMEVDIHALEHLPCPFTVGLRGTRVVDPLLAVCPDPLDLFGEHREVELGRIETGQVTVLQPFDDLRSYLDEFLLTDQVLVLDAVDLAGPGVHALLAIVDIVIREDPPGLGLVMTVREYLDETEFDDAVGYDVQPRAFNVEEQQGPFE